MEAMRFLLSIAVVLMVTFISFSNAEPEADPMADPEADPEAGVLALMKKVLPHVIKLMKG
ncbi:melittin [Colletes latitarsis]|uniref:melittin n=1 Tax=Colletes latitarsis TaxID=2605962 RepID=UPI004035254C